MRDSTKNTLRQIAFFLGVVLSGIGVILIAYAWIIYTPYSEKEQHPFGVPVVLTGAQTRMEFTAPRTQSYNVELEIDLPDKTEATKDLYWCLLRPRNAEPRSDCNNLPGRFETKLSVADAADKNWDNWGVLTNTGYAIIDGGAGMPIGFVNVQKGHRYAVTFRADTDYPALQKATAHLSSYLSSKSDQLDVAFSGVFAMLALVAAVPFLVIGIPLFLIGRKRKRIASVDEAAAPQS